MAQRLNAASALEGYAAAKLTFGKLHRELMDFNPSAARSLAERMEETLPVRRLEMKAQLWLTLAATNVRESACEIV